MHRKVIQQGPSTLMISLPSKWVRDNNIEKGDELAISLSENQLTASTHSLLEKKPVHITIDKHSEYLDRMIMGPYREGCNEIHITFKDPAVLGDIRTTLTYLLGFEIIDQSSTSVVIKNISEGSHEDYSTMFRRLFQIMLTISENCLEYVKTKDEKALNNAIDLRTTLTKLEQFNLRLINKPNTKNKPQEFFYVWHIATFGKMWSSLAKKQLPHCKLTKEEIAFFEDVVAFTRAFYNNFYKRDFEELRKEKQKLYKLREVGDHHLENTKYPKVFFYLLRMLNRVYEVYLQF